MRMTSLLFGLTAALALFGCDNKPSSSTALSGTPCQKFVEYQKRAVNVQALKIAVQNKKVPVSVAVGEVKVDEQVLRDAPELIQALDLAQFSACQTWSALPEGAARQEAAKQWGDTLSRLILGLAGKSPAKVSLRIEGRPEVVMGPRAKLDFGAIPAGEVSSLHLLVDSMGDPIDVSVMGREGHISAVWDSGSRIERIARSAAKVLKITVDKPPLDTTGFAVFTLENLTQRSPENDVRLEIAYQALAPEKVQTNQDDKRSGKGKDFSPPYTVCVSAPVGGRYVVDESSIAVKLTGDRVCDKWATCGHRVENNKERACLDFTLQGHEENPNAQPVSTGHISAIFRLVRSVPQLISLGG